MEEWLKKKQLIPNLKDKSINVMDNMAYHSRKIRTFWKTDTHKNVIKLFEGNNSPFLDKRTEEQLLTIITFYDDNYHPITVYLTPYS